MTANEVHRATDYFRRASFSKCCKTGYWFCSRCERVANLGLDTDEPARCPHCKHQTVNYYPPVL